MELVKGLATIGIVYTTHYIAAKTYDAACVPDDAWGFLTGLITTGSPICTGILNVMNATNNAYSAAITLGITRFALDRFIP
jgi:hypothetical protein